MQETPVVTVFLRNDCEVLLLRRSDAVGSYTGQWGAVAGHAEGDPDAAARQEIREETGVDPEADATLVRRGEPFAVADADLDARWVVHPFLFDCETTAVVPNEETDEYEWAAPTEILRRETVPDLWTSYDRVRPRVETVARDSDHGSASISLRALEVLGDEAAMAVADRPDGRTWADLRDLGRELVRARDAMPVVRNRVDRAMAAATERGGTAEALEAAADEGIERALTADREAAERAAERLRGGRIATLSRSGTVTATLDRAGPEAVLLPESRPGGEGVAVATALAERLGDDVAVALTSDAAFAHQLHERDPDALLLGADALLPDGRVVNKVGSRGAALAAAYEGIEVVVVAAADKLATGDVDPDLAERSRSALTDDERVSVANPTFDVTPAAVVDAVATERGVLATDDLAGLAAEFEDRSGWRR